MRRNQVQHYDSRIAPTRYSRLSKNFKFPPLTWHSNRRRQEGMVTNTVYVVPHVTTIQFGAQIEETLVAHHSIVTPWPRGLRSLGGDQTPTRSTGRPSLFTPRA